ncbi:hypothetical protein CKQ16_21790 [Salmonella enterica subsp. enterica serovar Newport]|nr:hypothetical protein [Salmonella enterica subsp. enterica serovar Newport]
MRELDFVAEHYGHIPTVEIAEHLGRTPVSVRGAANAMGCSSGNKMAVTWTEEEKEIIRTHYARGYAHILTLLPARTRQTIQWMAAQLGVRSARSWTREEERILAEDYPERGTAVADRLPGRTVEAVKIKASDMGIRFGGARPGPQRLWREEEWRLLENNMHLSISEQQRTLFPYRTQRSVEKARARLRKKKRRADKT